MTDLQRLADEWHTEFAKAFITQVSESGDYYIKVKFKSMADMHRAYRAMSALAVVTSPVLSTPQPNVDEGDGK